MSRSKTAPRHRSREVALQVLYAIDLAGPPPEPDAGVSTKEAFERVEESFELPEGARDFARALVAGVTEGRAAIDDTLAAHSRNWRIERMAAVDRNILRLAIYELSETETPAVVILDEAVELARRFGTDASPSFVNGVLDAVAHGLGLAATGAAKDTDVAGSA